MTYHMIVSNVCRANLSSDLLDEVYEKNKSCILSSFTVPLASEQLPPRQLRLDLDPDQIVPSTLKWHRDAYVTTITSATAKKLVACEQGEYMPQSLLVYSRNMYLADKDVQSNITEYNRVNDSNAKLVVVAVIGENRSCLSVCRNIAGGCQNVLNLVDDAKGAIESSSIVLIED